MQSQCQPIESSQFAVRQQLLLTKNTQISSGELEKSATKPVYFQANFAGYMDMHSDASKVADYLANHQDWFCSCATPMKTELLGNNAYILAIGRRGALGYQVETKIAIVLEPEINGRYLMQSIPVPDYNPSGYDVNYQGTMELVEVPAVGDEVKTKINWQMHLGVRVRFPQFVYKLPLSLIQTTGVLRRAQPLRGSPFRTNSAANFSSSNL